MLLLQNFLHMNKEIAKMARKTKIELFEEVAFKMKKPETIELVKRAMK